MKRETLVWMLIMIVGAAFLAVRTAQIGGLPGRAYVKAEPVAVDTEHPGGRWLSYAPATKADFDEAVLKDPAQTTYQLSFRDTFGIWCAAFFTLAIFSFLYKDNPFYKIAESLFVGSSAAYYMVVGFHSQIIPNLIGKLWAGPVKTYILPGMEEDPNIIYIVPLALGIMLLWRLSPRGGWISRWPLAFFIGIFCGIRLTGFFQADFVQQIRNTIVPLAVITPDGFDFWESLKNVISVLSVLVCLVYFFFSIEHKGFVGRTAKLGIWVLMITFGAGFGYTVMGRIALLAIRLEFLFDDWLWLIDPTNQR
jgi:hypothetical protein